jgi:hypothetical protein
LARCAGPRPWRGTRIGPVALNAVLTPVGFEAERLGEHARGGCVGTNHERYSVEAAHRMFRRNVCVRPSGDLIGAIDADERELHAVKIAEREYALPEARPRRFVRNILLGQPLPPIAERASRNDESGFNGHADAVAARRQRTPREEGQRRARPAGLVAVVEVPCRGVVEIDGFLDQPQPEAAGVEHDVLFGIAADRRHVMDACARAHHKFLIVPHRTLAAVGIASCGMRAGGHNSS